MRKLKQMLCRKEIEEINKEHQQLELYKRKINHEMSVNEKKYNLAKRVFELFPQAYITGVSCNDNEEVFVVHDEPGSSFYLVSISHQNIAGLPRLFYNTYYDYSSGFPVPYIHLEDIITVKNDIGNGSVLLEALMAYAKRIKATEITGSLSSVDADHADRRDHFYRKFGFEIQGEKITLDLSKI